MIKPKGRLIAWFVGLIIVVIVTQIRLKQYSNVLLFFWLSIPLVALVSLLIVRNRSKVNFKKEAEWVDRGDQAHWQFDFSLKSIFQSIRGEISIDQREDVFILEGNQLLERKVSKKALHVGPLKSPPIALDVVSEFGLFEMAIKVPNETESILVLPRLDVPVSIGIALNQMVDKHARNLQKLHLMEEEFDYLDTLRPEEPIKNIHWKLSARQQRFIVIRHKPPVRPTTHLWVSLDEPSLSEKDKVLELASHLINTWNVKGFEVHINNEPIKTVLGGRIKLAKLEDKDTKVDYAELSQENGLMLITNKVSEAMISYLSTLRYQKGTIALVVLNDEQQRAVQSLPNIQVLRVSDYEN